MAEALIALEEAIDVLTAVECLEDEFTFHGLHGAAARARALKAQLGDVIEAIENGDTLREV